MIGWWIVIAADARGAGYELAEERRCWRTGKPVSGNGWCNDWLMKARRYNCCRSIPTVTRPRPVCHHDHRERLPRATILPSWRRPCDARQPGSRVIVHHDKIAACPPDKVRPSKSGIVLTPLSFITRTGSSCTMSKQLAILAVLGTVTLALVVANRCKRKNFGAALSSISRKGAVLSQYRDFGGGHRNGQRLQKTMQAVQPIRWPR